MTDPNKVIHLPSGDELRTCVECGCAVLDADAHRRWHESERALKTMLFMEASVPDNIAAADSLWLP